MTSFDGTVVSAVTESVDKSDTLDHDRTLQGSSVTTTNKSSSSSNPRTQHSKSDILRQVFVPTVGWASQVTAMAALIKHLLLMGTEDFEPMAHASVLYTQHFKRTDASIEKESAVSHLNPAISTSFSSLMSYIAINNVGKDV